MQKMQDAQVTKSLMLCFQAQKWAVQARLSLFMSKCHLVENLMLWLILCILEKLLSKQIQSTCWTGILDVLSVLSNGKSNCRMTLLIQVSCCVF